MVVMVYVCLCAREGEMRWNEWGEEGEEDEGVKKGERVTWVRVRALVKGEGR